MVTFNVENRTESPVNFVIFKDPAPQPKPWEIAWQRGEVPPGGRQSFTYSTDYSVEVHAQRRVDGPADAGMAAATAPLFRMGIVGTGTDGNGQLSSGDVVGTLVEVPEDGTVVVTGTPATGYVLTVR